jgi:hypothetical protein
MTDLITPQERAKRQEAMTFAIASLRLSDQIVPREAVEIMQNYVDGKITAEEEKTQIMALLN